MRMHPTTLHPAYKDLPVQGYVQFLLKIVMAVWIHRLQGSKLGAAHIVRRGRGVEDGARGGRQRRRRVFEQLPQRPGMRRRRLLATLSPPLNYSSVMSRSTRAGRCCTGANNYELLRHKLERSMCPC